MAYDLPVVATGQVPKVTPARQEVPSAVRPDVVPSTTTVSFFLKHETAGCKDKRLGARKPGLGSRPSASRGS